MLDTPALRWSAVNEFETNAPKRDFDWRTMMDAVGVQRISNLRGRAKHALDRIGIRDPRTTDGLLDDVDEPLNLSGRIEGAKNVPQGIFNLELTLNQEVTTAGREHILADHLEGSVRTDAKDVPAYFRRLAIDVVDKAKDADFGADRRRNVVEGNTSGVVRRDAEAVAEVDDF